MKFSDTELAKRIAPEDLAILDIIAGKYGMTIGELCRMGRDADTGPYRYHMILTETELAHFDHVASVKGISRSALVVCACKDVFKTYSIEDIKKQVFQYDSGSADGKINVCISINCIHSVIQLENMKKTTGKSWPAILKAVMNLYFSFSEQTTRKEVG